LKDCINSIFIWHAAVKSRPVLHHCVIIIFWSSGIMDCTCMLFTFENGVPLMRYGASVVWLSFITTSDIFWSAFCVFHAYFWEKTHSFKICALKKTQWFSTIKWSNFRVEKCKTEENLSNLLNNMAYKTVTSMRDCVIKRNFMWNMNSVFILTKCICFIIKINHVWSRVKKHCFF